MKNILTYLLLVVTLAFVACATDDTFSASTANRLTFSTDTVKLDTVFSKVPSSTRTFWVFNNSSDGIRCSSIRLKDGNQTGFRVNVNGVYLGETQGYQLSNEEIRKGDSLRVFVEITAPYNNAATPQLVADDLVFDLESGVSQKVRLQAYAWDAELLSNVVISKDSTISSTKPTVIYGKIVVNEGATLTIPAGKTVYFHDGAGIDVHGRLLCLGEAGNEVTLRGDRLDHMFDYLPYDGVSGQWDGIILRKDSYANKLTFTDIHSCCNAVLCDSSAIDNQKLMLSHSTIHNCKGAGVILNNNSAVIENCQISNTLSTCMEVVSGDVEVNNTTLAQFYPYDAARLPALFLEMDTLMSQAPLRFRMRNSIVTGYGDDQVYCAFSDTTKADYVFDHCLLRTPEVSDTIRCRNIIWENVEDTIVGGTKNFKKVDSKLLQYDFRLAEGSLAIGAADKATAMPDDRLATKRDDAPDIGCYEYVDDTDKKE